MNEWSSVATPFIFILDFELKKPLIYRLDELPQNLHFDFENLSLPIESDKEIKFQSFPVPFGKYEEAFRYVQQEINFGNSYLLNLTFPTEIKTNVSLSDIFRQSKARYRIHMENEFVCFSPESFIKIKDGIISTFPMKGTIDAGIPNAENILRNDKKEMAEHATIVDLLRNDLSQIARNVIVDTFAYTERVNGHDTDLFQMSSKISGTLIDSLEVGTILSKLLPAGSVSGAPKRKTCEIIRESEMRDRGYYTGVCGIFDGQNLDSCVMIRFIEQQDGKLFYRSGGGITAQSSCEREYKEMIDKVYVPISRNHTNKQGSNTSFALSPAEA